MPGALFAKLFYNCGLRPMSDTVAAGIHKTYRANEHDTVLSEVAAVICVLMPRAFLVAGIDQAGEVVMARNSSYPSDKPAWAADFFEHELMNETLLGVPQQVRAVFVGSMEELLVPQELYESSSVRSWLNSLYAICPDDAVCNQAIPAIDAQQCFTIPTRIDKLLHRYFAGTPVRHVSAYQFHKPPAEAPYLFQLMAGSDRVYASLHASGKLLWHQQFAFSTQEDIAWQLARLCRELQIQRTDLRVQVSMISPDLFEIGPELERYYPRIRWNSGLTGTKETWSPVLYLLQQLYACAL